MDVTAVHHCIFWLQASPSFSLFPASTTTRVLPSHPSPSTGICFPDTSTLLFSNPHLCWLPLPSHLISSHLCMPASRCCSSLLGSCATHCNGSQSRGWATVSEILLSCFSLQVEHPQQLSGTSACFLQRMHVWQVRDGMRVPFVCSQEKIVLQASPEGCLSVRFFPAKSLFVLKRLLTQLHFQENSSHAGSDQGDWLA